MNLCVPCVWRYSPACWLGWKCSGIHLRCCAHASTKTRTLCGRVFRANTWANERELGYDGLRWFVHIGSGHLIKSQRCSCRRPKLQLPVLPNTRTCVHVWSSCCSPFVVQTKLHKNRVSSSANRSGIFQSRFCCCCVLMGPFSICHFTDIIRLSCYIYHAIDIVSKIWTNPSKNK